MDAPINVIGRTGAVLRAIATVEPAGASTSAIAASTALPRPTVHRLLVSLLAEGLVDRDASGRWLLGPELYLLGVGAASRYDVTATAQPFVRRLAEMTGESAFFSARRGHETVCLIREDGSFPIRSHVLYEGIRFPLGVASAGIAILAYLTPPEIEDHLASVDLTRQYGAGHAPDRIRSRIDDTRRDGYSVNPGLIVEGSWGMAAAVFDERESPRWALSLTGIEQRFAPQRQRELGEHLLRAALALSTALRSRSIRAAVLGT